MGHACTKGVDEDLEQMRLEREKRLGLVRVPSSMSPSNSVVLRQTPVFQQQHQTRSGATPARQIQSGGRPPTPSRTGSALRPSVTQDQRGGTRMERSSSPNVQFRNQDQATRLSWQPDTNRRSSAKPVNERTVASAPQSPERAHPPLARPLARSEQAIRPMVAQALNQLCAIELQHRMQILNEEFVETFQLSSRLEGLLGLEKLRVAGFELHTLERRSRDSILSQEMMERRSLWSWMGGVVEESRLSDIIRRTLESTIVGTPRSASSSRRATSPPRLPSSNRVGGGNSALNGNFDVPKHSSLKWTATLPREGETEKRGYVAAPAPTKQNGAARSPVRTVSPVDPVRGPSASVELLEEQKRAARRTSSQIDRKPSPDSLSAEELALEEKIARQRALMTNSKNSFGAVPHRAPPAAPVSIAVAPTPTFLDAAQTGGETQLLAAREESRAATRKRLNTLTGLR